MTVTRRRKAHAEKTPEQRHAANRRQKVRRKRRDARRATLEAGIEAGDPEIVRAATSKYLAAQLRYERRRSWLLAEQLRDCLDREQTTNGGAA